MIHLIDKCPIIEPDVLGVGARLPLFGDMKPEDRAFRGEGAAGMYLKNGILILYDEPTGFEIFGVLRDVFHDFVAIGESLYKYSNNYIGGLLITDVDFPEIQLYLPRKTFEENVAIAQALYDGHDEATAVPLHRTG